MLALSVVATAFRIPPLGTLGVGLVILLVGTYFTFRRQTVEQNQKFLRDLKRLLDDFYRYCFEGKSDPEDFRAVKLLDRVTTFDANSTLKPEEGAMMSEAIKTLQTVFQLWHSGLRQKVEILSRMGGAFQVDFLWMTVSEFVDFFNNYVEKVLEQTVWLANNTRLQDRQAISSIFNVFNQNFGHLRHDFEVFLKDFFEAGQRPLMQVKALKLDLRLS